MIHISCLTKIPLFIRLFVSFYAFPVVAGDVTHGLTLARQALCYWALPASFSIGERSVIHRRSRVLCGVSVAVRACCYLKCQDLEDHFVETTFSRFPILRYPCRWY